MRSHLVLLAGTLVVPTLIGCGATSSTAPPQASQSTRGLQSVRADVRFGLTRQQIVSTDVRRGNGYLPDAKRTATLFVSDMDSNAIRLFPAKKTTQKGTITTGIDLPVNIATDLQGTVYVANNGNSTVTEYRWGQTSPSVTLRSGTLLYPNGIVVSDKRAVYVTSGASVGQCYVLVYPHSASGPSERINGFDLPVGLALDKNQNLYVGDTVANAVWRVARDSQTPTKLSLAGLNDPSGVAIDSMGNLWVANDGNNTVLGFHLGDTTPFVTITDGLSGPYSIAFERNGTLYVGSSLNPGHVTGYKSGSTSPFETIGIPNPAGLAVYPRPKDCQPSTRC